MHPSELFESSTSEYLNKMRDNYQVADTCFDQVYDRALPQQEAFEAIEEDLDRLDRDYTLSRLRQSSLN
jgi:hypothetical protein